MMNFIVLKTSLHMLIDIIYCLYSKDKLPSRYALGSEEDLNFMINRLHMRFVYCYCVFLKLKDVASVFIVHIDTEKVIDVFLVI